MANSILSSLFSKAALNVVNETSGVTVLKGLNVLTAEIGSGSQNTDHPVATEQVSNSSTQRAMRAEDVKSVKIIRPARVKLCVLVDSLSSINAILAVFAAVTTTVSITSKSVMLRGMALTEVEIEQNADMLSATKIDLEFEQANPPGSAPSFNPAQQADLSSLGINVQVPTTLVQTTTDLYNKVSSSVGF